MFSSLEKRQSKPRASFFSFYLVLLGLIYNVTPHAVGVILTKRIKNRIIQKKVNVRIEHIKHSDSRREFLQRVQDNAAKRADAKAKGIKISFKRLVSFRLDLVVREFLQKKIKNEKARP